MAAAPRAEGEGGGRAVGLYVYVTTFELRTRHDAPSTVSNCSSHVRTVAPG